MAAESLAEGRVIETRIPVRPALGRGEHEPPRPVDHFEDVPVALQAVARGAERDAPDPADAQVAVGMEDPAWVVLPVDAARGEDGVAEWALDDVERHPRGRGGSVPVAV